jgi:aryl-alcohol dehydrogenase-like predicted oxidoreductase
MQKRRLGTRCSEVSAVGLGCIGMSFSRCERRSGRDNPTIGIEYVADWLAERFGINQRELLELRR